VDRDAVSMTRDPARTQDYVLSALHSQTREADGSHTAAPAQPSSDAPHAAATPRNLTHRCGPVLKVRRQVSAGNQKPADAVLDQLRSRRHLWYVL
jgi:hypothetical protein